jgi:hypothetical protein
LTAIFAFDVPFPWIALAAGMLGDTSFLIAPDRFRAGIVT